MGRGRSPQPPSDPTLRVAYVCTDPGVPVFGSKGASVHVQEVIGALARLGASVQLFATSFEGQRTTTLDGVGLRPLPDWPRGKQSGNGSRTQRANRGLSTALSGSGPFHLVYERYALWSFGAMEYARTMGVPSILEVNAPLIDEESKYRQLRNRPLAEVVAKRAFGAASNVLAVSSGVANYLSHYTEAKGKVLLMGNAANPERFPEKVVPSRPAPAGVFTVGFVGTLKPWHGLDILVSAFEVVHLRDPRTRLLIVGDGPEKNRLRDTIRERGLSGACEFTGAVPPWEVPALMASMDVGVAPYPSLEGFYFSPLKVVEYMAAGKPVVASKVGDLPDLVGRGNAGLLVPPSDPRALAEAILRLRRDSKEARAMGESGRSWVMRNRTWDIVVRSILEKCGVSIPTNVG